MPALVAPNPEDEERNFATSAKNRGKWEANMLWPREEFHAAYGQIKHDGIKSGGCSALILVALDVDALCACEILTSLFKADFLSYTLLAVRGYDDILRIREARIRDDDGNVKASELRSVIMINCGAIVNVMELLALPPHMRCYIFDSHRPIHLANIYDQSQQIVVFDDGSQSIEDYPADGSDIENDDFEDDEEEEDEEGDEEDDEEEDDGDDDDDDEGEAEVDFGITSGVQKGDGDGEEQEGNEGAEETPVPSSPGSTIVPGEKRKRVDDDADEGGADDVDADDGSVTSKKIKDLSMSPSSPRHGDNTEDTLADSHAEGESANDQDALKLSKRKRREEILRYYRGSYNGAPAATVAFELAQQMNSSQRDLLWFAIIGLTKQFVMEEIDSDNYNLMIDRFQDEVLALDTTSSSTAAPGADDGHVLNPAYEHGKITFEEEFRFMCYRHWSLYEAMYYSDYVASKLGLYLDQARRFGARSAASASDGETSLHVFLARMGFSLRQSQQKFTYMPLEMKQMLREKTQEIAPEFGLDDLFYGSFKRQFAFQYQLCAADAVRGLQALLEAPESYISSVFQAENHQQQNTWASMFTIDTNGISYNGKDAKDAENENGEELQDFRQQNFVLAHTALSCRSVASSKLMESGIKVAMELKQAIVRVGISIMERKLIVRVKHFRYISLTVPEREQELFANANVLTQLALFLLNVHRASGKWGGGAKQKPVKKNNADGDGDGADEADELSAAAAANKSIVPLVLITRNPAQNCFLVVGITCPTNPGEIHRNTLGTAFKLAAGETGANFRQDGFTSAVMEIQMDEIQYFVEQLHNVLDA